MQRAADATKQRHRAAERLIKRMKTRSLMLAMQLWLEGCDEVMRAIEERAREMQIMSRFFDKFFHHATAMAWTSWREYVLSAKSAIERAASAEIEASNRHVTVRRVVHRLAKRQEARCFRAWDQFRYAMAKHEMDLAKAEAEQLQTAHAKGDSLHRLVARSASRSKRRRFNLWGQAVRLIKRSAAIMALRQLALRRLTKRLETKALAIAMHKWPARSTIGVMRQRMASFVARRLVIVRIGGGYLRLAWALWQEELARLSGLLQKNQELVQMAAKLSERLAQMEAQLSEAREVAEVAAAEGERRGRDQVRHFALHSPSKKRMGKLLKRSWDSWCGHVALLREQEEQSRQAAFNDPVGHALGNVFGGIAFWDNNGGL